MEVAAAAGPGTAPTEKRHLSRRPSSSSSFRLRCPSLNTLRLRRVFDIFDKNGDGMITVEELHRALNLLGLETDISELESTVASHVKPGNDGLGFEDFVSLHESLDDGFLALNDQTSTATTTTDADEGNKKVLSQEEADLSEAFKVFDEDGDGFISAYELQVVLGKLGLTEGNEIDRVQQMIGSVDRNRDGRVDFFEFKNMMQSVLVRSS